MTTPLLGEGFDPWYVLLSPPETNRGREPSLISKPSLPVRTVRVDYGELAHQAELRGKEIVRDRWRELRSRTPAERAAIVLSSKQFRAGNSLGVLEYLTKCFQTVGDEATFTLPSFPFKVPNPAKVVHRNFDAGELLCLRRLHLLNSIVTELLDVPSRFVIISDGKIYADVCGTEPAEYERYSHDARDAIEQMGLTDRLAYVDMIDDVVGDRRGEYEDLLERVQAELSVWWEEHRDSSQVQYLVANMEASIDTTVADFALAKALEADLPKEQPLADYRAHVSSWAERSAFLFMSKLVTLRIMNAVQDRYPGSIRCTVHPKQGQYGIHLVNSSTMTFPWQGTTVRRGDGAFRVTTTAKAWETANYEIRSDRDGSLLYYSEVEPEAGAPL
jgi:pyoverdine/dityrosine biosynthesis protein Dit1